MLCSTPELTALNWVQEESRLCPTFGLISPHCLGATGLINLLENILMVSTFLLVGEQHRQVDACQVNRHSAAALAVCRTDIDQQSFLPARQVDIDIGQQLGIEQSAVQGTPGIVNPQTSA